MKKLKFIGAFLLAAGIVLYASESVEGAQGAMRLWVSSVAPAVFPFLVLMPLLTGAEACSAYAAMFGRVMQPLFHLPGEAAPAVVISMIAGSPGGMIASSRIAAQCHMKRGQAWRLALGAVGVSPAFLIAAVGAGMYGSSAVGGRLAVAQMGCQLLLLFLLGFFFEEEDQRVAAPVVQSIENPVRQAVMQVLLIGGYMVFFSSIGAMLRKILGGKAGSAALLVLDLPSGLAELANWNFPTVRFVLGAVIGFGGVCIGMQNLDAAREIELPTRVYIAVRMISAVLMGTVCMYILPGSDVTKEIKLQNPMVGYAFSMLIAAFIALPGMIYLSDKYFLNKMRLKKMEP